MTALPTHARPAQDWGSGRSARALEPAIAEPAPAAGLPVPAEDGGAIAVFRAQEFAARRRGVPVRLLR